MIETLLERTQRELISQDLGLLPEVARFVISCDSYAMGAVGADELQGEMCRYMDKVAQRSRAMSRAISRTREPPLADVFTEATNMVLDAVFRSKTLRDYNTKLMSEKTFRLHDGKWIKPDVSIWRDGKMIAVVECKTNMGFARGFWQDAFDKRAGDLYKSGLREDAVFLFVATEQCWSGFSADDDRTGKIWFSLCPKDTWPGGGKQGEAAMSEQMIPGTLQRFFNSIESLLQS